jgi:hypothetical protein
VIEAHPSQDGGVQIAHMAAMSNRFGAERPVRMHRYVACSRVQLRATLSDRTADRRSVAERMDASLVEKTNGCGRLLRLLQSRSRVGVPGCAWAERSEAG